MAKGLSQEFNRLAQRLIEVFSSQLGVLLKYDEPSLEYLDGFIERNNGAQISDDQGMINFLGAFLGECVIASYGGQWHKDTQYGWGVRFENGEIVFPFAKVAKRFAGGEGDSIAGFCLLSGLAQDGTLKRGAD